MDETTTPNTTDNAQQDASEVVIYSTPTCHYCNLTKDFFKENNVTYTEFNVAEDTAKRAEMIEKSGQMGVPVIMIKGNMMIGFNEEKLRELLSL